ncbi:hypothetical protein BDV59DRAFT_140620 [Aspergillus ambiguus]|uniref:uncharacterized protein n=1 Tax=Aspergillus ambiguus TaxID=176160 RepID=UPI003CCDA824
MVYDKYNDVFEKIIHIADQICELSPKDRQSPFSLETHLSAALYFTARKCPHPLIRRRAISLLAQQPEQEGMWDTKLVSKIARYNMELEEKVLSHLPVEKRVPEDQNRFYDTAILDSLSEHICMVRFKWKSKQGF